MSFAHWPRRSDRSVTQGAELGVDPQLQRGLRRHLPLHLVIAGLALVDEQVKHLQGLGIVAIDALEHRQALLGAEGLELGQLGKQVIEPGKLALAVGEVQRQPGALGHLGDLAAIHAHLKHFAVGVAGRFARHGSLIGHHHQGRQGLGRGQPIHPQYAEGGGQVAEGLLHVVAVHAEVAHALDGVHQPQHVPLGGAGRILQLGGKLGRLVKGHFQLHTEQGARFPQSTQHRLGGHALLDQRAHHELKLGGGTG